MQLECVGQLNVANAEKKESNKLSPDAIRILEFMRDAKPIGVPDDPNELSHSQLAEERMDDKFPWLG